MAIKISKNINKEIAMALMGHHTAGQNVKVKISGDGARMTRLTNYVIMRKKLA